MRVLLAIPPWSLSDTNSSMSLSVAGTTMPGGVAYLASALRRAGHQVEIADGWLLSEEQINHRLRQGGFDVLGLSAVNATAGAAARLARAARRLMGPGLHITAGGQGPSGMGQRFLELAADVDSMVVGEGEEALPALLSRLPGGDLTEVPGVVARVDGQLVHGPPPRLVQDLDTLAPPALDLLDLRAYVPSAGHYRRLPVATVTSSRGCPNHCIFCYQISGHTIRIRSPRLVVDEIVAAHLDHGVQEVIFWDENFTHDRDRVLEICDRLEHAGNPVIWWCAGRVDGAELEMLRAMRRAGCWQILFGVESGSDRILQLIGKNTNRQMIQRAFALARQADLRTYATFILGHPTETEAEALASIRFARQLRPDIAEFFPATPFFGTELRRMAAEHGQLNEDLEALGMHLTPFVPHTMTRAQLERLRRKAHRDFYMRPSFVLSYLSRIRSRGEVVDMFKGAASLLADQVVRA